MIFGQVVQTLCIVGMLLAEHLLAYAECGFAYLNGMGIVAHP